MYSKLGLIWNLSITNIGSHTASQNDEKIYC